MTAIFWLRAQLAEWLYEFAVWVDPLSAEDHFDRVMRNHEHPEERK